MAGLEPVMGYLVKYAFAMALGLALALAYERLQIDVVAGMIDLGDGAAARTLDWVTFATGLALGIALGPVAAARWSDRLGALLSWLGAVFLDLRRTTELAVIGAVCVAILIYI